MNASGGNSGWQAIIFAIVCLFLAAMLTIAMTQPDVKSIFDNVDNAIFRALQDALGQNALAIVLGAVGVVSLVFGVFQLISNRHSTNTPPATMSDAELTGMLSMGLNFTPEDVQSNRTGVLSAHQAQTLKQSAHKGTRYGMIYAVFLVVFFIALGAYILFLGPMKEQMRENPQAMTMMIAVFGGTILLVVIYMIVYAIRNRSFDDKAVQVIEGRVRLNIQSGLRGVGALVASTMGSSGNVNVLHIGRMKLYLTDQQIQGFWNGSKYRIYYLKTGSMPTLLSAELVER